MKSIYRIVLLLVLVTVTKVEAQQDPNYTLYRYNMNLINPAYAGSEGTTNLGINIRSQWANVKGAPETQSFLFGTPIGKNVGLGLSIISDKTFIEKQTSLALDFSYHLKLNDVYDLYFGIKGSFNSYIANANGLVTYGVSQDPKLMNLDGRLNPNFGAGLYLKHKDYFLSFSIPKILNSDRLEEENGVATVDASKRHMYLAGGYNVKLSNDIVLKPSALLRYVEESPLSIDLTAILEFNGKIDLGAAYRINESVSGLVIFNLSRTMQIGYAYETSHESSVRSMDNGSHEIMINLKF
ncbi:PorP/SprF family type IX secretion system membrane protein [Confluentibacter sediminis]|uniref:PorP/SprF family type IX secretion system membrane protein n=1 Tax=Confluentibacter sediminis TaxID=2219045 RepID=UPI000DAD401C|nr:type IX secretion system membrane protein PorP/SprF [Confluentibacter sediminis]